MKSTDWIKVEDRLPKCEFGDRKKWHFSKSVLVAISLTMARHKDWIVRIARYDKIKNQWLNCDGSPYNNVEYWMPIELPEEE